MKSKIIYIGKRFFELLTKISPNLSSRILFFIRIKKFPNLKNPQTFNEKATWLKLNKYANDELVIKCADKYRVREYIESKGYASILNELYGVYDNFNDIDFSKLPQKFALKCNHGCAYNLICEDKSSFDIKNAEKKVNSWLKEKYGCATTELHYTKIKPKIIIEKYLCDKKGEMPTDYKFYCFNGKVKFIVVCSERGMHGKTKYDYYDTDWNELPYGLSIYNSNKTCKKPKNLNEMIKISEDLSSDFPFVRVDLYNTKEKIIFGELTFTPACSCDHTITKEADAIIGKIKIKVDDDKIL